MPMRITTTGQNKTVLEFENTVSIWNVLKESVDAPYLKSYVVTNYDGGNTLVPIDIWEQEQIMYREIEPGVYLFPYESAGFVFDDSIDNADIYVIDSYDEKTNYKKDYLAVISISATDTMSLTLKDKTRVHRLVTIYLLSILKVGYNTNALQSLNSTLKTLITSKTTALEFLKGTLTVGLKGVAFILKITEENDKFQYYQMFLDEKCKKKSIKEKDIKNLSYLKKKLLAKNKIVKSVYFFLIWIFPLSLVIILPKIFFSLGKSDIMKFVLLYYFVVAGYKILRGIYRRIYLNLPKTTNRDKKTQSES